MRILPIFTLIILTGCSGKPEASSFSDSMKMSSAQIYLNNLKDSLKIQYSAVRSTAEKQVILDICFRRLKDFLRETPMDSLRVTIDEVKVNGFTVTTKSHIKEIEFSGKITFEGKLPPRVDSIYKFMKNLRPGSSVLLNMAFDGDFQLNRPDSPMVSIFKIGAYPIPIQYKAQ
jgi:hypothetical protein